MHIKVYELIKGAKEAKGICVIIDVFRAFSLEACLFHQGAECVYPLASLEEAYRMKKEDPDLLLVGERGGKKCEGFDYGNSPSAFEGIDLTGRKIVHTTSAGTQGIENAVRADEILTGSFLNAKAIARYIKMKDPEEVSLVCMGNAGKTSAKEDLLCAEYIKGLLEGKEDTKIEEKLLALKDTDGKKFFDEKQKEVFPEKDFWICIRHDLYDFVILCKEEEGRKVNRRVNVP